MRSVRPVIHRVSSVTSTQDEARRKLAAGQVGRGHVIVADEQTAGRGRFGRRWSSPRGGLYATFLVAPTASISLAAGIAVARALDRWANPVGLKWPNDIVWNRKKLAGILVEADRDVAFIGVGVNVDVAPVETAASLREVGAAVRRGELVLALWEELQATDAPSAILAAYRARSITIGQRVRALGSDGTFVEGLAVDVGSDGELIVESADGVHRISSGECEHLNSLGDTSYAS